MPEFGYNDRDGMVTRSYRQNDFVDTEPDELVVSESRSQDARTVYAPDHIRRIMAIPARNRKSSQKRALKKWRDARKAEASKGRAGTPLHETWVRRKRKQWDVSETRQAGNVTSNAVFDTSRTGVEIRGYVSDQHNDADRAARVASIPSNGRYDEHAGMPGVVDIRTKFDGAANRWIVTDDAKARVKVVDPNRTHNARHSHDATCNYGDQCIRTENHRRADVPTQGTYLWGENGVRGLVRMNDNWTREMEDREAVANARRVNGTYSKPRGICESDFE